MNMQTVAENLRNTIAGKEAMLDREQENRNSHDSQVRLVSSFVVRMLEINIDDLKRILQDVEQCIPSESTKERDMMKGLWKV